MLLGSFLFAYPQPDLIDRTFAPYLLSLSLTALLGLWVVMATAFGQGKSGPITAGVVLVVAALQIGSARGYLEDLARVGRGYATDQWRTSETARAAGVLPPEQILVSNEPTAVLLYTDRNAFSLGETLPARFACRSVAVVLFAFPDDDSAAVPAQELPQAGELWDSFESYADGTIYHLKPQSGCASALP